MVHEVLQVVLNLAKSGSISFWYKTSSENSGDCWLEFAVDNNTTDINPNTEWKQFGPIAVTEITSAGLSFYVSSFGSSEDSYTVWIDQMTWVPSSTSSSSTITITEEGWQQVTFDVLPDDPSPTNVFAAVADKVDRVVHGGQSWGWESGGRLTSLTAGVKYWVHTKTSNVSWTVEGESVPAVEDDVYGPFGRSKDISKKDDKGDDLKPTVYGNVLLTFSSSIVFILSS